MIWQSFDLPPIISPNFIPVYNNFLDSVRLTIRGASRIPDSVSPFESYIYDNLPDGITSVRMHICALTAAVTAVTATFYLSEERSRELEEIVNRDVSTRVTPASTNNYYEQAYTIASPAVIKQEAVDEWRTRLRGEAARWLAGWLPGSFYIRAPGQPPTIELLLTEQHRPWAEPADDKDDVPDWMWIVRLRKGYEYWQCDHPSLRLQERIFDGSRHLVTLGALRSEFFSNPPVGFGDVSQYRSLISDYLLPIASRCALTSFLLEQSGQLAIMRDLADRASSRDSPRALTRVQRQLMQTGLDGNIVVANIVRFAEYKDGWNTGFLASPK